MYCIHFIAVKSAPMLTSFVDYWETTTSLRVHCSTGSRSSWRSVRASPSVQSAAWNPSAAKSARVPRRFLRSRRRLRRRGFSSSMMGVRASGYANPPSNLPRLTAPFPAASAGAGPARTRRHSAHEDADCRMRPRATGGKPGWSCARPVPAAAAPAHRSGR